MALLKHVAGHHQLEPKEVNKIKDNRSNNYQNNQTEEKDDVEKGKLIKSVVTTYDKFIS